MEYFLFGLLGVIIVGVAVFLRRRSRITVEPGPATPERGAEDARMRGLGRGGLMPKEAPDSEEEDVKDEREEVPPFPKRPPPPD